MSSFGSMMLTVFGGSFLAVVAPLKLLGGHGRRLARLFT